MANTTFDRQRIEAAAAGLVAKYRAFSEGLTPDEHAAFECIVRGIAGQAGASADDVAGYKDKCVDQMVFFSDVVKAISGGFLYIEGGTCVGGNFASPQVAPTKR